MRDRLPRVSAPDARTGTVLHNCGHRVNEDDPAGYVRRHPILRMLAGTPPRARLLCPFCKYGEFEVEIVGSPLA